MNKLATFISCFLILSLSSFAESFISSAIEKKNIEDVENYNKNGGYLYKPSSQKGEIFLVSCQSSVRSETLTASLDYLSKITQFNISITNGTFNFPDVKVLGSASLYVVDDSKLPPLLTAPESRWTVVNVASLKCDKDVFFDARVKKEISRGFAYLCGGAGSQFPKSLLGPIPDLLALDRMPSYELPVDSIGRMKGHMRHFGVTPARFISYINACNQGWAPAPTNDVQKAIWDKVHEIPTEPITIKPESHPAK